MMVEEFPKITNVTNPRFTSNGNVLLDIEHQDFPNELLSYCASPNDVEEEGRILFAKAQAGNFGPIKPFDPQPITGQKAMALLRMERNEKLKELDKILMNPLRWADMSEQKKAEFSVYRNALLDLPQNHPNISYVWGPNNYYIPLNLVWPFAPSVD